jgi:hypothetical protein
MSVSKYLVATINVLTDTTTHHFPLLVSVSIDKLPLSNKSMEPRNFKKVMPPALLRALETWLWSDIYQIKDPNAVVEFIYKGIVHGMDQAAPLKRIRVKEGTLPLYLRPDTLALMAQRDSLGRGLKYKAVRNRVTALVRRDKELSNLAKLAESKNSPTVLWDIVNAAVGKPRQLLPATVKDTEGNNTEGNLEAANVVNTYYVEKVWKIQAMHEGCRKPHSRERYDLQGRRYEGKFFSFNFFLWLCERGQDCKSHHRAQVHVRAWHRWDPRGHPQGGVQCLGPAHLPPGQHVAGGRHLPVSLQDGAYPLGI